MSPTHQPFESEFYVQRLQLESFRQFQSLDQTWGRINVLVGPNGSGKSTLLRALSAGLAEFAVQVMASPFSGPAVQLSEADLSIGGTRGGVGVEIATRRSLYGSKTQIVLGSGTSRTRLSTGPTITDLGLIFSNRHSEDGRSQLPLVVAYPPRRDPSGVEVLPANQVPRVVELYHDAFSGNDDFAALQVWFRMAEDLENQIRVNNSLYRDTRLTAVRTAVQTLLPGFTAPRIQREINRLVVDKQRQSFVLNDLSDGERNLLAVSGDIARRLALASPTENPLLGFGVVLIDEIEQHLHPGWQRMVVPKLAEIFPNLQFFVTTHSPLVASSVPPHSLYLVHDGTVSPREAYGQDVALVLDEVFETWQRDYAIQDQIDELLSAIAVQDAPTSVHKLEELEQLLGSNDPELVRARTRMRGLGIR